MSKSCCSSISCLKYINVETGARKIIVRILHERRGILHVLYMCITFALTQLIIRCIIHLCLKLLDPICLYVVTYQVLHALFWKRRNLCFSSYGEQTYMYVRTYTYDGSVGGVCPTHILDEKGGSSENIFGYCLRAPLNHCIVQRHCAEP